MPRKTSQIIGGILIAEVVEEEERVELLCFAETKGALQLNAGSLNGGLGFKNLSYGAKGHGLTPLACKHWMRERDIRCNKYLLLKPESYRSST
jgi:hypothetical protein